MVAFKGYYTLYGVPIVGEGDKLRIQKRKGAVDAPLDFETNTYFGSFIETENCPPSLHFEKCLF